MKVKNEMSELDARAEMANEVFQGCALIAAALGQFAATVLQTRVYYAENWVPKENERRAKDKRVNLRPLNPNPEDGSLTWDFGELMNLITLKLWKEFEQAFKETRYLPHTPDQLKAHIRQLLLYRNRNAHWHLGPFTAEDRGDFLE